MTHRRIPLQAPEINHKDGLVFSKTFREAYHPGQDVFPAIDWIFLNGNRLPERWFEPQAPQQFTVLEIGFGMGFSMLATARCWLNARDANLLPTNAKLHLISIEKHPFDRTSLRKLHNHYLELQQSKSDSKNWTLARLSEILLQQWPEPSPGIFQIHLDEVSLHLHFGDAYSMVNELRVGWDALYLDGFTSPTNADAWQLPLLKKLARLSNPKAILATKALATAHQAPLKHAGFIIAHQSNAALNLERFTGSVRYSRPPAKLWNGPKSAVIIGAGLAGCAIANQLSQLGWKITLIERNAEIANEASGNPAGSFHPHISSDDAILSRLTRAGLGFLHQTIQNWERLDPESFERNYLGCGHLKLAEDESTAESLRQAIAAGFTPQSLNQWQSPPQASAICGLKLDTNGVWFPKGGALHPRALAEFWLSQAKIHGAQIMLNQTVTNITKHEATQNWVITLKHKVNTAINPTESCLTSPVVILATAFNTIFTSNNLKTDSVRGQLTYLARNIFPPPNTAITGQVYLVPPLPANPEFSVLGASFDRNDFDPNLRQDSQLANLQRLASIVPAASQLHTDTQLPGRVSFRSVTIDRLPVIGPMADETKTSAHAGGGQLRDLSRHLGLFAALGYGSKGIIWAPLAAEIISSQLEGSPIPLEGQLLDAIDPGRFLLTNLQKQKPPISKN